MEHILASYSHMSGLPALFRNGAGHGPVWDRTAQLAAIVEYTHDAIISRSLDGTILSWNAAAERIYGYSAAEAIGSPSSILQAADNSDEATMLVERALRGEPVSNFETTRIRKDGKKIHVSVTISPVKNAAGEITGISTIARDITERKQAEAYIQNLQSMADRRGKIVEATNQIALDILSSGTGVDVLYKIAEASRMLTHAIRALIRVRIPGEEEIREFEAHGTSEKKEEQGSSVDSGTCSDSSPVPNPDEPIVLSVPLLQGETILGELRLTGHMENQAFSPEDEATAHVLARHATLAIQNILMLLKQRALVQGMIAAHEDERRQIAYELHDGLTQYVMASHAHMEAFRHAYHSQDQETALRELEQGLKYLKEAVRESRHLVSGLRPLALDDMGLEGALELLINEEKKRTGWEEAGFVSNIGEQRFDSLMETAVYRVAQEALTNVCRHSGSERVNVSLQLHHEHMPGRAHLVLEVRDWGCGFTPEEKSADYSHLGLHGMAERVNLMGGEFRLESEPGKGTRVYASFPLAKTGKIDWGGGLLS